jgi:hypothetical protein
LSLQALQLTRVNVSGCVSSGNGGGLVVAGAASVSDSTVTECRAGAGSNSKYSLLQTSGTLSNADAIQLLMGESDVSPLFGGGISVEGGSLFLARTLLANNSADKGGSLSVSQSGTVWLLNASITDSSATYGGAHVLATRRRLSFSHGSWAGGMVAFGASTMYHVGTLLARNRAARSGGGMFVSDSATLMAFSNVVDNWVRSAARTRTGGLARSCSAALQAAQTGGGIQVEFANVSLTVRARRDRCCPRPTARWRPRRSKRPPSRATAWAPPRPPALCWRPRACWPGWPTRR